MSGHDLGPLFAALADDTRREILGLLAGTGDQSATRLAQRLPISRQAVVKHLTALEAVGTVRRLKHGREILFRVDPDPCAWPPGGSSGPRTTGTPGSRH